MAAVDQRLKKTWDDVQNLKAQIGNILDSLKANKDLDELNSVPVLQKKMMLPPPPKPSATKSSFLSRLSKQKKQMLNKEDCPVPVQADEAMIEKGGNNEDLLKRLQFDPPVYDYVESETFLIPVLDRWFWGTTITNLSITAASFPLLHLRVLGHDRISSSFSYTSNVCMIASDGTTPDVSYRNPGIRDEKVYRVQPGSKAHLTASFLTPVLHYTESSVKILATLFLNGKFQWSQEIDLDLINVALFNDEVYKRFQMQIFYAMVNCEDTFTLLRKVSKIEKPSPFDAFRNFLESTGFEGIKNQSVSESHESFICDVPSLLFGVIVKLERTDSDNSSTRCLVSTRSRSQLESLLRLISNWIKNESTPSEKRRSLSLRVSTQSILSFDERRSLLLAEIKVLNLLGVLHQKGCMDSDIVVQNWLTEFSNCP